MKPVVGIFAHPDDESFGPGGTLAIFAKTRPVYTICVTNGDAGLNSSKKTKALALIRREELIESGKILGVKKVYLLDYGDGTLSNNLYHEIADKIEKILREINPEIIMTFEPRGISGHIDHIAVSMVASFLFEKLNFVDELWQHCIDEDRRKEVKDYFIYYPPGYKKSDISKAVNITDVWETKLAAMDKHESQKHDKDRIVKQTRGLPKIENFIIRRK